MRMKRISAILLVVGVIATLIGGSGILACFSDIENSIGTFATDTWRDKIYVDIKPTSCPNPININSGGKIPIAILGTTDFEVVDLDPTTTRISYNGTVSDRHPTDCSLEDVGSPFYPTGTECCHTEGKDGIPDWNLHFNKTYLINDLLLYEVPDMTTIYLNVTIEDYDHNIFKGTECVRIQHGG